MTPSHAILVIALLAAGGAALAQTADQKARSRTTSRAIVLENGRASIAFDRGTGALVSLANVATGDEYLKRPGGEGNPFRLHIDAPRLPAAATQAGWWGGPLESDLGGRVVDAAGCRLTASSFRRSGASGVLTLSLRSEAPALALALKAVLRDGDDAVDLSLTVRSEDAAPHTLMAAFPHLVGLQLGPDASTNKGHMMASYGTPGVAAWTDTGGFYGRETSMQFQAVYEPALNEGLGLIVMDPALRPKLIRRGPQGAMTAFYLPAVPLAPGASHTYPTARLVVHRGSWRIVARRYGEWLRQAIPPRKPPSWLRDVDLFVGTWIPAADAVAEAKQKGAGFTSFRQMPLLYLNDPYDLKEWAMYNEGVYTNPSTYGPYMGDGTYYFRSDLGGPEAMREGVRRLHAIGRRVTFYVAGNSILQDSEVLKGTRREDWMLMDAPGHSYDVGYPNGFSVCPGYAPWQDHLAKTARRILAETGADGIRLDELAGFVPCYNPAHRHEHPFGSNQWLAELGRKVRAAMDEVNPDAILLTENPLDHLSRYFTGALQMFQPGTDIDVLRVALPSYVGMAYHPGAVESALNGWIGGKVTTRRVEWPWAHRGLSGRPAGYAEGSGPAVRWHELRAAFAEAIVDGQAALEDPQAPDAPDWAGRVWQGKRYWLLVGGKLDGTPLGGPARVRVPGLPAAVKGAYEIDAATLAVRDAALTRSGGQAWVTVTSGFSAVLLPMPTCPPLLQAAEPIPNLRPGQGASIALSVFAPWRAGANPKSATVSAPGLTGPARVSLPGSLRIAAPQGAAPGLYPLRVTGNVLALKRWVRVVP